MALITSVLCALQTTIQAKSKMQVDFGDYVISPMYKLMTGFLTGAEECLETLNSNRATWLKMKEDSEAAMLLEQAKSAEEPSAEPEAEPDGSST